MNMRLVSSWPPAGWKLVVPGDRYNCIRGEYWLARWRDEDTDQPRYKLSRIDEWGNCVEVIGVYPSGKEALEAHRARVAKQ